MHAVPERDALARVAEIEPLGVGNTSRHGSRRRSAAGRSHPRDRRARVSTRRSRSEHHLHGCVATQCLLDDPGRSLRVARTARGVRRPPGARRGVADQVRGRDAAGDEQRQTDTRSLLGRERAALRAPPRRSTEMRSSPSCRSRRRRSSSQVAHLVACRAISCCSGCRRFEHGEHHVLGPPAESSRRSGSMPSMAAMTTVGNGTAKSALRSPPLRATSRSTKNAGDPTRSRFSCANAPGRETPVDDRAQPVVVSPSRPTIEIACCRHPRRGRRSSASRRAAARARPSPATRTCGGRA